MLLVLLDIVTSIADIVSLAALLFVINFYTQPGWAGKFHYLPAWLLDNRSLLLITLFFILFSVKNLLGFLVYRAQCRFITRVASRIAENKLSNYLEGAYEDYVDVDSSIHIRKIAHEPVEFSQHILGGIQQLVTQTVLILLTLVAMVLFNAKMFLLLFIVLLPPVVTIFYLIKKRVRSVRSYAQVSIEKSLQHLQEALSAYVESNIYNKNPFFLRRYTAYQRKYTNYFSELLIVQGIPNRMIEVFALLGLFILIAISQWSGGANSTAIITVGAFMAAAYKIIPGMVKILTITGQMKTYEFTVGHLLRTGKSGAPVAKRPADGIQSVEFRKVRFLYTRQTVLDELSFGLGRGDFLGISGHSGKGKTTILNLLLGFLSPEKGEILINACHTDEAVRKEYRRYTSYVRQQSFLIHDTLLRNIVLDDAPHDPKKLEEVIGIAGLGELIDTFPDRLEELIAENGKNISGGQRQRIAIARALYKDADLIVLDEPFNELDEASETALLRHLAGLAQKGKMIIMITHNKKTLSFCNKTLSLDEE